jgi:hypothetical protein
MTDEPTFCAQTLNFLHPLFKSPSMTDSWCVGQITSNDHEPLIAHLGSYDADGDDCGRRADPAGHTPH